MGQRLQVFIHIHNPAIKLLSEVTALTRRKASGEQVDRKRLVVQMQAYETAFGNGETTNIAYHHQWMYGRSALVAASNVLLFNKYSDHGNPFKPENEFSGATIIDAISHVLSSFNCPLARKINSSGLEPFRLLNFVEPEFQKDCCRGDNNDGIIVIDCINHKYGFVNIHGDSTIEQLPYLEPVSAEKYVKLYYPECNDDSRTANISEKTESDILEHYRQNRQLNKVFLRPFKEFPVMTKDWIFRSN